VGREPTAGELYAAHFLGPQGSAKLIEAAQKSPAAAAAGMFPDAAAANRTIFYRDGRPATVAEVYANLTRSSSTQTPVSPRTDDEGFIQYASARRIERVEQERELVEMVLRGPVSAGGQGQNLAGSMLSSEMLRALSQARDGRQRDAS
jgi:hypothetical protein